MLYSSILKEIDIHRMLKIKPNFSAESIAFFFMCQFSGNDKGLCLSEFDRIFLVCLFTLNRELRQRLFLVCKNNWAVRGLILFLLWIAISSFWSVATYSESLADLWSWRKLMLFPMAIVLVNSSERMSLMIKSIIMISLVFCFASWMGHLA